MKIIIKKQHHLLCERFVWAKAHTSKSKLVAENDPSRGTNAPFLALRDISLLLNILSWSFFVWKHPHGCNRAWATSSIGCLIGKRCLDYGVSSRWGGTIGIGDRDGFNLGSFVGCVWFRMCQVSGSCGGLCVEDGCRFCIGLWWGGLCVLDCKIAVWKGLIRTLNYCVKAFDVYSIRQRLKYPVSFV